MARARSLLEALGWTTIAALLSLTLFSKTGRLDLDVLLTAAKHLDHGGRVYDLTDNLEHTKIPLVTLLFIPLSRLPVEWVERLWDLLNLIAFPAALWWLSGRLGAPEGVSRRRWVLLAAMLALNPWNTEVWTGQINVLLWIAVAAAGFRPAGPVSGALLAFALAMKPPHLIALPWVWRRSNAPVRLLLWAAAAAAATAGVYLIRFGPTALAADLSTWASFLPLSTAKHIYRPVNYGLPAVLRDVPHSAALCLAAGALAAELFCWTEKNPYRSLCLVAVPVIVASPMCWYQNYSVLAGLLLVLLADVKEQTGPRRWLAWAALALWILGFPLLNPEVLRQVPGAALFYEGRRIPLWAALAAAVACAFRSREETPISQGTLLGSRLEAT